MKKWIVTSRTPDGPVFIVVEAENLAVAFHEAALAGYEPDQCDIEEAPE